MSVVTGTVLMLVVRYKLHISCAYDISDVFETYSTVSSVYSVSFKHFVSGLKSL